jgi:hypothetical protein
MYYSSLKCKGHISYSYNIQITHILVCYILKTGIRPINIFAILVTVNRKKLWLEKQGTSVPFIPVT